MEVQFRGSKGLFSLQVTVRHQGKPRQEPWRNTAYWFVPSGWLSYQVSFIQVSKYLLPRNSTAHSGLDSPPSISSQENTPQMCPQAILVASPQLSVPFPGPVWVMTKLNDHSSCFNTLRFVSLSAPWCSDSQLPELSVMWKLCRYIVLKQA